MKPWSFLHVHLSDGLAVRSVSVSGHQQLQMHDPTCALGAVHAAAAGARIPISKHQPWGCWGTTEGQTLLGSAGSLKGAGTLACSASAPLAGVRAEALAEAGAHVLGGGGGGTLTTMAGQMLLVGAGSPKGADRLECSASPLRAGVLAEAGAHAGGTAGGQALLGGAGSLQGPDAVVHGADAGSP